MIPRIKFANLPTPIEPLVRLGKALGGVNLWVKRDDLTGLAFGGNKTRKLEYVLAGALERNAKTLITVGSVQSNHCRQTAALAARYGLDCILVLSGDALQKPSGNLWLDQLLGAEIVWTNREERMAVFEKVFKEAQAGGREPYLIPLGASDGVGTLGYVTAFSEFLEQGIDVDWIIVASSSAGTQAGLALGEKQAGWRGKVLGISIDHPSQDLQCEVARLANEAAKILGWNIFIKPEDILVDDHYLGQGYGVMGKVEIDAIRQFAVNEGLLLDPVYTGRAAAGMIDLIQKRFFQPKDRILFWHTGGTPALFAENYVSQFLEMKSD